MSGAVLDLASQTKMSQPFIVQRDCRVLYKLRLYSGQKVLDTELIVFGIFVDTKELNEPVNFLGHIQRHQVAD